jgi:RHS repeat-associated protein
MPRALLDPAGRTVWLWDAGPFGTEAPDEDPDGDGTKVTLNLRLPGQYYDAETGLRYNGFRDYDPATGRYVEPDPIGLAGGLNVYGYVGGDPVNRVDPDGRIWWGLTWQILRTMLPLAMMPSDDLPGLGGTGGVAKVNLLNCPGVAENTTRLWRAVEPSELQDVLKYADYNIHPNSTFKRFAFDEASLDDFIKANPGRDYTKTFIDLPTEKLDLMYRHSDPGGVGKSIGVDVYETPEFYNWFNGVTILK